MFELLITTAGITLAAITSLWVISIIIRDVSIIDMAFSGLISVLIGFSFWKTQAQGPAALITLFAV